MARTVEMPWAPATKIAESPLFQELRDSVAKETVSFTFTCGGTIPITTDDPHRLTDSGLLPLTSSRPIDLRWDSQDETVLGRQTKITFPLEPATKGNLEQLIKDMQPATFGMGGRDVYDESYRKATKLDTTRFSSTFNPYELGIVDTIAQTLLPTLRHSQQTRAVRAELYKLNIYSGPSGKFKAHVDTPRSSDQFGTLVVCLPLDHQGGALEVRHNGRTVRFDWSSDSAKSDQQPAISWAALYSDCEHEVLEVTQGHRLTLTYNLYSVRGNGQLGGNCPMLDPTHLPLYRTIFDLVHDAEGWKEGGYVGYLCNHVYPHSTTTTLNFLAPDNLKGADMLIHEIFRSLNLKVSFRPTIPDRNYEADPVIGRTLELAIWNGQYDYDNELSESYSDFAGEDMRVYTKDRRISTSWESERYIDFKKVHWLNDFGHTEPQISYVAYGNEADAWMAYSSLALMFEIPPGGAANAGKKGTEDEEDSEPEDLAAALEKVGLQRHWRG